MQDFNCCECQRRFDSASSILQHFAFHASENKGNSAMANKKVPDLYPISVLKQKKSAESDLESDSGVEDVNPIKFCLVTMAEDSAKLKKYECHFCSRKFGWPTDLKRHILIHTGEKPFRCQFCDCAFTRNFLLKKHQRKSHGDDDTACGLPGKSRKQEKSLIKRRIISECQSEEKSNEK